MTPLALRLYRDLLQRKVDRLFMDQCDVIGVLPETHYFDVSEVLPLAKQIHAELKDNDPDGRYAFLPAGRTWVEYSDGMGGRTAFHIHADGDDPLALAATVRFVLLSEDEEGPMFCSGPTKWRLGLRDHAKFSLSREVGHEHDPHADHRSLVGVIYSLLALINSPNIIGRRTLQPHRDLQRKLIAARPIIGSFPLGACTKIVLEVPGRPPRFDGGDVEGNLTGERCLHFVRTFCRMRQGRLEYVRAHWRGNAANGIKRSIYDVQPRRT